jgi:DNA/RNA-binding protein KIN17
MPKAEFMSPKYIANKMKSKGLQKLKFYCQACEKQCRDENGFKCHINSESHHRQMLLVAQNPGRFIFNYSSEFKKEFLSLLSRRHGTKRVLANRVYQEYIAFKEHIHMNATRWNSLSGFCRQMCQEGILRVDENERGLYIAWIDNSPKTLAKQAAIQRMERARKDDDEREIEMLKEQVEKAAKEAKGMELHQPTELKRNDASPIKLSLSFQSESTSDGGSDKVVMGGMTIKKRSKLSSMAKTSPFSKGGNNMMMMTKKKVNDGQ